MRLANTCLAVSLCLLLGLAVASNILGVFPHRHIKGIQFVRPLIRGLAERGHNVTMISPTNTPMDIEGVRHLRVNFLNYHERKMIDRETFLDFFKNKWTVSILAAELHSNISEAILNDQGVKKLLHNQEERFDMVLIEATHLEALFGLADHFNATLVGVSGVRINWFVEDLAGNPSPSIFEPISPLETSLEDSHLNRFLNWLDFTEEWLLERLVMRPAQQKIFNKHFASSQHSMEELRSRVSIILINNHFSLGRVRANVPNIIEVGGLHLSEPPERCNEQLQRFMDEAEDGVIYFSMGRDILFTYLPENMRILLQKTFAKLKQRVVWKNDDSALANSSENIYVIASPPQRMVLEHPKVRLFITHGGLLSVMESVHSGVPMLGIPFFFDQFKNLHRLQQAGMAEVIDFNALNAHILNRTIKEILENPRYAERAKEISHNFRDRPMSPLDTAVWWTEYVLRNRDAGLMRLNQDELPFMLYYRLDYLLPLGFRIGIVVILVTILSLRLIGKRRKQQSRLRELSTGTRN